MQSLKGCHWERAEGKQNDLGKALAKVTLHSQDPDAFLHPPPRGLPLPFWFRAPLLPTRGTSQLLCMRPPQRLKPRCKQKDGLGKGGRSQEPLGGRCETH